MGFMDYLGFGVGENAKTSTTPTAATKRNQPHAATGSVFKRPTVAIVDAYLSKNNPVDLFDRTLDISHGQAVELFVLAQCPAANIERKNAEKFISIGNTKTNSKSNNPETNVDASIELMKLAEEVKKGKKLDAVNLSIGQAIKITTLAKATGLPLTRENLDKYKAEIRAWIMKRFSEDAKPIIEAIEQITAAGIPVYHAAGSQGADYVNFASFANGVTTVGALAEDNKTKAPYSADNSVITRWERGDYFITRTKDKKRDNLYDINEDGKTDILGKNGAKDESWIDSTFFPNRVDKVSFLEGTSFSTPVALGEDLRAKFGSACDLKI